jgi:Glycosyltransferase family 87
MSNSAPALPEERFVLGFNDGTLALVGAAILLFSAVWWTAHGPNVEKTDFSLTYVGAKIVHDGMGSDLYNISLQKQLRNSLYVHPVPLFFEHPPFEALLLSPLAGRPFRTAYLLWGIANAIVWLAVIFFLRRHLPWPGEGLGYISMWLLFAPLWVALYQGQSSLLLLAAYSVVFVLLKRQTHFAAGAALGLGLLKFQFVLPFAFIFLLRKKWLFLAGFVSSALVLVILSIAAVGWKGVADYVRFLLTIGSNPRNISYGSGVDMPTIHGFVLAILGRRISGAELNAVVAILSVALLSWIAWRWKDKGERMSFELMFAAAIAASLLSGSHMFTHDFSPLVLAMFLAASHLSDGDFIADRASAAALRTTFVLFWTFPLYFVFVKWHCLYLMGPVLLAFVWGTARAAKLSRQKVDLHPVLAE